ncbi:MAG: hypothetical protein BZY79_02330 [SAR202 cluster bacterium Casp-Chloro-G4]|nr:EVE domain-containing protein [Chloroflexota bacterium]MDA1228027.1 EVE domain-containing protein [Chloroflexota bacterium]PKB61668.1 MAG: hypothetical protein BZY79_02330 [SAR202 cluster bacterium Casp-Chloro-G4]
MGKNYWMMVASPEDFEVTKEHGFTVYGVRGKYRRRAQRMQPDDRMLFYVKGLRKWTATATITSLFFEDRSPIWNVNGREEVYPFRVKTKPEIVLDEEDYIDALMLAPRLEYVKRWAPEDWPLAFFDSLHLIPQKDFRLIEAEMNRFVGPKRNRPLRNVPDSGRGGDPRQANNRGGNGAPNTNQRNGLIVPQSARNIPTAPIAAPYDEREFVSPASPVSGQMHDRPVDEHGARPVIGQTESKNAQDSVVDDHPATEDSSTSSSTT